MRLVVVLALRGGQPSRRIALQPVAGFAAQHQRDVGPSLGDAPAGFAQQGLLQDANVGQQGLGVVRSYSPSNAARRVSIGPASARYRNPLRA